MKTLFAVLVLMVSTISFAGEGRDASFAADRIERRNEMKKENKMNNSDEQKAHCRSEDYKDQTTGC